jgi:hypothetical protein
LAIQLAGRGKTSIVPSGYQLVAGDHDFHVVNLTPSVTLLTEVKANLDDNSGLPSFYKGMCALTRLISMYAIYG